MAIYHSRVKTFSRARGDSPIAAAAYRAGALLIDHMTGKRHDYRRRGGVAETACFVPNDAPEWATIPRAALARCGGCRDPERLDSSRRVRDGLPARTR